MDYIQTVSNSVVTSFQNISPIFLPIFIATLVFLLGLLISTLVVTLWRTVLEYLSIEKQLDQSERYKTLKKTNSSLSLIGFGSFLIWWLIVLIFSTAAVSILGFDVSPLGTRFLQFLPVLASISAILILGVFLTYLVFLIVAAIGNLTSLPFTNLTASAISSTVLVFSVILALQFLNLDQEIFRAIILASLAALALGFGLALKEPLAAFIKGIKK